MAKFFWGNAEGDRGIHWKSWEELCKEKDDGGLGFRDLECSNLDMLAKQGWQIATRQTSLLFKILKGRYFQRSSFLHAKLGANPSFGWRSLLEGRKVLSKGLRWRVGDEEDVRRVLFIPLSRSGGAYRLMWIYTRLWFTTPWTLMTTGGQWKFFREWWIVLSNLLKRSGKGEVLWEVAYGSPPRVSFMKINCDEGWSKDSLAGTSGAVCRDSNGDFRGASFRRMEWVTSSLMAEAYALRDGLYFAWKINCRKVELESDSKTLIHIFNGEYRCPVEVEVVVADIFI
ncbi:hypothetical protein LIER_07479 [Lithospermum erythrorhizon]|uniref:RNase H type-1 domain-containing protein n=1 Tax=Lithospermum erythrorhizon TaxID=34254 RepID=A0AAV3P8Y5_LITER